MTIGRYGLISILLVGLALGYVGGFFTGSIAAPKPANVSNTNTATNTPPPGPTLHTYRDDAVGLELPYDKTFTLGLGSTPDFGNQDSLLALTSNESVPSTVRASLTFDKSLYSGTNLVDAWIDISAHRQNDTDAALCNDYSNNGNGNVALTQTKSLNGITWQFDQFGSAAAGTDFSTEIFHTSHNGECIELALTEAEGNIGNYADQPVKQVDVNAIMKQMEAVVATARFTN